MGLSCSSCWSEPAVEPASPDHQHREVHESGVQQPWSCDPQPPPSTQLLSLPHHLISAHILPHVPDPACMRAFAASCKATHSMSSSTRLQADWLRRHRPATALYLAAEPHRGGSQALLLELLKVPSVLAGTAAEDVNGRPLLYWACHDGCCHVVIRLLELKMDPNARTRRGFTPLMAAAEAGHALVVEVLCRAEGIDVGLSNIYGETALHRAARTGHEQVVLLLLDATNGLGVGQVDVDGRTAMHHAAGAGHAGVVRLLLRAGSGAGALDVWGRSALHLDVSGHHASAVRELLQARVTAWAMRFRNCCA